MTRKFPFQIFFAFLGVDLVDNTFLIRKGENLAWQTSSKEESVEVCCLTLQIWFWPWYWQYGRRDSDLVMQMWSHGQKAVYPWNEEDFGQLISTNQANKWWTVRISFSRLTMPSTLLWKCRMQIFQSSFCRLFISDKNTLTNVNKQCLKAENWIYLRSIIVLRISVASIWPLNYRHSLLKRSFSWLVCAKKKNCSIGRFCRKDLFHERSVPEKKPWLHLLYSKMKVR